MAKTTFIGGLVLKAKPAKSPRVIVTDAYLKPLAGAKVYVKQNYGVKGVENEVGATDSAGEVTIPALYPGGSYTVRVALLGYCPNATTLPEVGGPNWIDRIEFAAEPATSTAKGKVVDSVGSAVAGANVTTDFGPVSITDANGQFTLQQMPDWPVRLEASKGKAHGSNVDAKCRIVWNQDLVIVLR